MNNICKQVLKEILDFQKKNDIKGQCLTHTQYLYDSLNVSGIPVKAKAVIAVYENKEKLQREIVVHMCLQLENGKLIDPSYEINNEDAIYIDRFSQLPSECINSKNNKGLSVKEIVVGNREYYHKLAEYMETITIL